MQTSALDPVELYRLTPRGVEFTGRELTGPQLEQLGSKIAGVMSGATWAIGDWLVYAIEHFGDNMGRYDTAVRLTGRSYDSLSQAYRVSKAYDVHTRLARVPWVHYREALRLPPHLRTVLLRESEKNRWSRDQLSQAIENALAEMNGRPVRQMARGNENVPTVVPVGALPPVRKVTGPRVNRPMRCPRCGHKWTARLQREAADGAC